MLRPSVQRPSVIVGAWTLFVLGVFVARGDLRLAEPAPATSLRAAAAGSAAPRQPVVVRAETAPRAASPTVVRRGRIYDALGFLVVGAEVVPMDRPPTRTDGDGSFAVDLAAGGVGDLLVRAEGLQPTWWRASAGSPDPLCVQLAPAAPWDPPASLPGSLPAVRGEGVVRIADGRPLGGAYVTAEGTGIWARADDIGRFVLPLPTPTATLLVHEPEGGVGGLGFFGAASPLVAGRAQGAVPVPDLVAAPATAVRGIVRDARGQPIAGVPVEVAGPRFRRLVETGAGGAFRVGGLAPGAYRVQPFAWRGAVGRAQDVTLDGAPVDLDLQLVAADEVRLRVVDERSTPVAGVFVATVVDGLRRGIARADADGWAEVPVAAGTAFDVRTSDHHAPVAVRRYDAEPATLVVAMP